jgi:sugar fermentation stimulation protein A
LAAIEVSLPFTDELYQVRFLERPNKFLLRCVWDDPRIPELKNQAIEAHLPDPGRLKELLIQGCPIWVRQAAGVKRKTQWSTVLCQVPDGRGFVSLDTTLPNRLVGKALKEEA